MSQYRYTIGGVRVPLPDEVGVPQEPEVGEYVNYEYLVAMGGTFYQMNGKSYCDTPLWTFVLEPEFGYRRIE